MKGDAEAMIRLQVKAAALFSCLLCTALGAKALDTEFRRIPVEEYVDKMKAAWIGQMVGVGWGQPTQRWLPRILREDEIPPWDPRFINQFYQDDLYVDMTFLRTLEVYGLDVSIRQAGIDFANTGYRLWHANLAGRENLRNGIAPPDSSHPQFHKEADDIDYQIEADYSGIISPGLPNSVIRLGELFGRLMNYGDGMYGGQFSGGMYAEAFFENDPEKIVRAGLRCVPEGSQYHEAISDVLAWHEEFPGDWQKTWERISDKYWANPDYRRFSCHSKGPDHPMDIDAKINGAFAVVGMLYGKGDPEATLMISMRCGQDSDCNPSTAAGVVFTTLGFTNIPQHYVANLNEDTYFGYTEYNFPRLIEACEKLARQVVIREGGRIEKDPDGREVFVIPVQEPKPSQLEQSWNPGPIASSRFTEGELRMINPPPEGLVDISQDVAAFAPGWSITDCGGYRYPGFHKALFGKTNVLATHPRDGETACVLSRRVEVPAGKNTSLRLVVGHDPQGDWKLIVKANGDALSEQPVDAETAKDGWMEVNVDLSKFAGQEVDLELLNEATGWDWEIGLWAEIAIESH